MKKLIFLPLAALLAAATGCETLGVSRARDEMQAREDMLLVQEDMQKLNGRLEGVELQIEQVQRQMDGLRAQAGAPARALESRLNDLEAKLRAVEAAREKDKQELLDRLSAQIAKIVASSGGSGGARRQNARRAGSDTGYEHTVQSGETLSEIATAYGVSVKTILDNNNMTDPNKLRVGQKLFIPE